MNSFFFVKGMIIIKKLVLYSEQIIGQSEQVDQELKNILAKDNPKIAYIPSQADLTRKYFTERVEYYKRIGINDFMYFDLEHEYDEAKLPELLSCDAIHLSGGNTFYFLNSLKKRNFINHLLKFVEDGGVLIGISAGSILMSETIIAAAIGDDNFIGIKDLNSLGLVDFDFYPHWKNNYDYLEQIISYSIENPNRVCYVCKDSDGIIVNNNSIKFIGTPFKVINGEVSGVKAEA